MGWKKNVLHSKLDEIAHVCTCFDLLGAHIVHTKAGVHTRGDLYSIGIRKLARSGPAQDSLCGRDVRRRKDGGSCNEKHLDPSSAGFDIFQQSERNALEPLRPTFRG
jgi:hypothetical protein